MAASTSPRRRIPPRPGSKPARAKAKPGIILPEPVADLPLLRTSERGQFKRCPQKWWWGSVEGLQPAGASAMALWFGTGWHLLLAHHYGALGTKRGKTPLKVWRDYVGDEIARIRVNKTGEDWSHEQYVDARELGEMMWEGYIETYGNDPTWDVIQAERVGHVLIRRPGSREPFLNYSFTYDLVYRDLETGRIMLGEHKTAKQISIKHLDLDDQAGSYWAIATSDLRASGLIGPRERLHGIMYNFAKKSPKDQRELGPDGMVHNLPRKEHYIALFEEEGVDVEDYSSGRGVANLKALEEVARSYDIRAWGEVSKNQPTSNFLRHPVKRTQAELRSQIARIESEGTVMEQFRTGALPLYKNPTKDCSWDCQFYDLCLLHERGSDWEEYRDAVYVHGDPYEPYRKSSDGSEE